jgi:hypothetical protein
VETVRLETAARRLHAEIRGLVAMLPEHAQGVAEMVRYLKVDRMTCRRIVAGAAEARPEPALLVRLPGARGLRQFLAALERIGIDAGPLATAEAAVREAEEVVRQVAGSQSRLAARLRAEPEAQTRLGAAGRGERAAALRERLAGVVFELIGKRAEVKLAIVIMRPCPDDPTHIDRASILGTIGHSARPDSPPLVVTSGRAPESGEDAVDFATLVARTPARGRTPQSVLREFTTDPPPLVSSRTGPTSSQIVQVIDAAALKTHATVDVVTAGVAYHAGPHPARSPRGVGEEWALMNEPAGWLIHDVYLHREMARGCIPSVEHHLWRPGFESSADDRWYTRLPDGPRLEILGPGLRSAAADPYPRHEALTARGFELLGWDASEFVGYRCQVRWPLWRAGYCMSFDFGTAAKP